MKLNPEQLKRIIGIISVVRKNKTIEDDENK